MLKWESWLLTLSINYKNIIINNTINNKQSNFIHNLFLILCTHWMWQLINKLLHIRYSFIHWNINSPQQQLNPIKHFSIKWFVFPILIIPQLNYSIKKRQTLDNYMQRTVTINTNKVKSMQSTKKIIFSKTKKTTSIVHTHFLNSSQKISKYTKTLKFLISRFQTQTIRLSKTFNNMLKKLIRNMKVTFNLLQKSTINNKCLHK